MADPLGFADVPDSAEPPEPAEGPGVPDAEAEPDGAPDGVPDAPALREAVPPARFPPSASQAMVDRSATTVAVPNT
ncbi:hypothetical protein AB0D46_26265 [Streptomyces sp. NPDC048383]|uniref:hypothetical protein n=1 Tax=Streptomyces sp. NPDC048383 TaxID=3155386 RepID=UPI003449B961